MSKQSYLSTGVEKIHGTIIGNVSIRLKVLVCSYTAFVHVHY